MYIAAFFERREFIKNKSENESLVLIIIMVIIKEIMFFEKREFVKNKSEDESLVIIIIMIKEIMFFEGKEFIRGRSKDEPLILIIIVIIIERIMFAVFNSESIRDLIISIIVNLTNSIISLLMASERYED
jgi:hypothetical protein